MKSVSLRNASGQAMLDLPWTLCVLFIFLCFPLLTLGAETIRYGFLLAASRDAAHMAAAARTFQTNSSSSDLSACNVASGQAALTASKFTNVTVNSVTTNIVIIALSNNAVTRRSTPLSAPADTTNNLYGIEVVVNGTIAPLIAGNPNFPRIPGLSGPITLSVTSQEISENPQGLNQ
jgi:Flp pilus assembly protein TadG